jgi:hypothetical protein
MSASSASTITCSALLFSFSPTANCKGRSWLARFYHGCAGQPKGGAPGVGAGRPRRTAVSNWPTIPQLYVKSEFVGGCDIVREMLEAGELTAMLDEKGVAYDKTQLLA